MNTVVAPLFEAGDASDISYVNVRDHARGQAHREYAEQLWRRFAHLADPHFRSQAKVHFHPRFWEMYLAVTLMERGFKPVKHGHAGPEYSIKADSLTIHFDAIAPGPGTGADAVPAPEYGGREACQVPDKEITLRLTAALNEKRRKFELDVAAGRVADTDACIVAINGSDIPGAWFAGGAGLPHIVKAVYPIGNLAVGIDPETLQITKSFFQPRDSISKVSGGVVPTTSFMGDSCSRVSGLIYSCVDVANHHGQFGSDFIFVHNSKAAVPIPLETFKFGQEFWLADDHMNGKIWG